MGHCSLNTDSVLLEEREPGAAGIGRKNFQNDRLTKYIWYLTQKQQLQTLKSFFVIELILIHNVGMVWPTPFCIPKGVLCLEDVSNLALLNPNKRRSYVLIPKNCDVHALVASYIRVVNGPTSAGPNPKIYARTRKLI